MEARGDWPATDVLVGRAEQQQRVLRALLGLDEPYRSTLLGQFQEGLTPAEISARSGVPVDTVRWRLRRGIEQLKGALQRDVQGGGLAAVALGVPAGWTHLGGDASVASTTTLGSTASAAPTPIISVAAVSAAGAFMSKGIAIGMAALAVVIGLFFARTADGDETLDGAAKGTGTREPAVTAQAIQPTAQNLDVISGSEGRVVAEPQLSPSPTQAPVDPSSVARFEGFVVQAGRGVLGDATVRASVYKGFDESSTSGSEGAFVLDVPYDPAASGKLMVSAGPFLTQVKQGFGPGRRGRPIGPLRPLSEGPMPIGPVTLAPAGVVKGRIVGPDGMGIAQGWIGAGNAPSVEPGADGSFSIPHVGVGTVAFDVIARGMLDFDADIEVVAGEITDLGTLRLAAGGRVSGRITGPDGQAVPGAEVSSRGFTRAWSFKANGDGSFDIPMPSLEPCDIYARAPGFDQRGELTAEPGARDVHIVLESQGERCSFQVVDGVTGEPLPTFGVDFGRGAGEEAGDDRVMLGGTEPTLRPWNDGRFALTGRPGLDAVMVWAPGYKRQEATIAADAVAGVQVLSMGASASLRGRIVAGSGDGVEGIKVVMLRGSAARFTDASSGERTPFAPDDPRKRALGGYMVPKAMGIDRPLAPVSFVKGWGSRQRETTTTMADGVFSFEDCQGGVCALYATNAAEMLWTSVIAVSESGATDLGDLRLAASSTVSGRLELGLGDRLDGHRVFIELPEERELLTDSAGAFRFTGVPAGPLVIRVAPSEQVYESPADRVFGYSMVIEPGVDRDVILPLRTRPSAELSFSLTSNGAPFPGRHVTFEGPDGERVGKVKTGVTGDARLRLPFDIELDWHVSLNDCDVPGEGPITLREGANRKTLDLPTGSLVLSLPIGMELPKICLARLYHGDAAVEEQLIADILVERVVEAHPSGSARITFDVVPLDWAGPGPGNLTVVVMPGIEIDEGAPLIERTFPAELVPGEAVDVKL